MNTKISSAVVVAFVAVFTGGGSADAALYYVNSSQPTVGAATSSAGSFRYVMQHTNYDQNIFNGVGSLAASNIRTAEFGNVSAMTNRVFTYSIENRPGQGLIFSMTTPAAGNLSAINSTLAWGTFSTPVSNAVALIDGVAPSTSFNVISLFAGASRAGSSMSFSNFTFTPTSPELTLADGGFYSGVSSTTSGGSPSGYLTTSGAPTIQAFNTYSQALVSDGNLAGFGWTLSGQVTGIRDASGSGSAQVSFQANLSSAPVSGPASGNSIPEPASMGGVGLAGLLLTRRRRVSV